MKLLPDKQTDLQTDKNITSVAKVMIEFLLLLSVNGRGAICSRKDVSSCAVVRTSSHKAWFDRHARPRGRQNLWP